MSFPAARFRVVSSFVAFHAFAKNHPFVMVPIGSIIEAQKEFQEPGLVAIRLDDQSLLAFMRDIEDHTVRLHRASVVQMERLE